VSSGLGFKQSMKTIPLLLLALIFNAVDLVRRCQVLTHPKLTLSHS